MATFWWFLMAERMWWWQGSWHGGAGIRVGWMIMVVHSPYTFCCFCWFFYFFCFWWFFWSYFCVDNHKNNLLYPNLKNISTLDSFTTTDNPKIYTHSTCVYKTSISCEVPYTSKILRKKIGNPYPHARGNMTDSTPKFKWNNPAWNFSLRVDILFLNYF